MSRLINWFGLCTGIITIIVVAISLFMPWWQLTIGQDLIKVNASPINTNFYLFGTQFTVPLLVALNIGCLLTLAASGALMLVYSLMPGKTYAKQLLGFSYKKPLYVVIGFLIGLIAIIFIAGQFGLTVPFTGSANLSLPSSWNMGVSISALVTGNFALPFWLAIVTAALSIVARVYHVRLMKRIEKTEIKLPTNTMPLEA